jgi:hypothetical protein
MTIESNYVDSHGASFIGFGLTRLLGFDLIARFKQINHMKLYLPDKGSIDSYPLLAPALTRPIRWDLIDQQYDPMIKYSHRNPARHSIHRSDPAAVHARCHPPRLRGDAGAGPCPAHHLLGPLATRPGPATRDHRCAQRRRKLQRRQRLHPLRQVRRTRVQPPAKNTNYR